MKLLSRSEEIVLLSIWKLQDNAYGITIREEINQSTGQNWAIGAIYPPLHRLEKKGMVATIKGEPIPEQGSRTINIATAPGPAAPLMVQDYPEVLNMVRLFSMPKLMFSHDDKHYYESWVMYADDSFFNVFSFQLLQGNPETALIAPNTVVITGNMAKKYFGINDPIGKILRCGDAVDLRVTGII